MAFRAARVLIALGASIGAFTLTLATAVLAQGQESLVTNAMGTATRRELMGLTLATFAAAFVIGALLVRRHGQRGLEAIDWLARLLSPLLVLPLFAALTHRGFSGDLEEATLLAVFVICLERLLRVSFVAWGERPLRPPDAPQGWWRRIARRARVGVASFFARPGLVLGLVMGLSIAHGVVMSIWAVWAHQRFSTYGYDLGQYDQLFETALHGKWMAAPAMGHPENWGDLASSHADFILFPLLPFYALHPRATTLLVMQAMFVATAAIPLYLFARQWVSNSWAFVLALAWLGYAPMHCGGLYDLHTQPFGAAFVVWAICALEYRKWAAYWVFFVLAISCREDVSMGLAAFGLFVALSGHRFRTGIATAALSTVYFCVVKFGVMSSGGFVFIYKDLTAPGEEGFGAVIQTLISNPIYVARTLVTPDRARYFFQILAPLAFLPVRRPAFWVVLAPAFILTLLTTGYGPTLSISFQYVFNWAAYAFPAAAVVMGLFGQSAEGLIRQRAAAFTILAATVLANLLWGAYAPAGSVRGGFADVPFAKPLEADRKREEDLAALMLQVPDDANLCTSDRVQSHTTHHLLNWSLKDGTYDCEYLLWSDLPGDNGASRGQPLIAARTYAVKESRGGLTLAQKFHPPPPPPPDAGAADAGAPDAGDPDAGPP